MPEGSPRLEKQPKKKRTALGAGKKPQARNPSTGKPASGNSKPLEPSEIFKGMFADIARRNQLVPL